MKIRPVRAGRFHVERWTDGRTDRHDEAFQNYANSRHKIYLYRYVTEQFGTVSLLTLCSQFRALQQSDKGTLSAPSDH
jgi:hypothetical protein